jgi:hypothetical protein
VSDLALDSERVWLDDDALATALWIREREFIVAPYNGLTDVADLHSLHVFWTSTLVLTELIK